jgi:hypothetical protein
MGNRAIWHVTTDHGVDADSAIVSNPDARVYARAHPDNASLSQPHIAG